MSENKLSRHEARELVFKLIFAKDFDPEADAGEFYNSNIDISEAKPNDYVLTTFLGVNADIENIDKTIEKYSVSWKLSRMSVATRSVLRLAVYELTATDTPVKVIINEAVEIIKNYDDENAPSFVNGILNNAARALGKISD